MFEFDLSQNDFSFSQNAPEDVPTKVQRDLLPGVLHVTIAMCRNARNSGTLDDGKANFLGKQWARIIVVGFIQSIDTSEDGVWYGTLRDYTGTVAFRYEVQSGMPDSYEQEMKKISPPKHDENVDIEECVQWTHHPCKVIGLPQVVDDEVIIFASHLRAAEYEEAVATHILETASQVMEFHTSVPSQPEVVKEVPIYEDKTDHAVDPYDDEPIPIADPDISDIIGADRLRQVIYKYLDDARHKEHRVDETESVIALRQFCSKKWKVNEINEAIDDLVDSAVVMYVDDTKMRVQIA